jgi:RHS repeat-associated protein
VVGSVFDRTYNYDANGNITSVDDGEAAGNEALETAGKYSYDQGTNLLANIWGPISVLYDYDNNANTVSANNRTFVYDLSNQLIRVLEGSNQIAEYTYNGTGQRIKKVTRIFHYDLWGHIIAETNQSGMMLAEYVYLGDQLLAMIRPGEIIYYYHNDHLGTPQILTSDNQNIVWKAAYTPFGGATLSIQTVENPFRLPGQYYDAETGLHYNYFRYYDPTTGRYLTPDPIGLFEGINLFSYVDGVGKLNLDRNRHTHSSAIINRNLIRKSSPFRFPLGANFIPVETNLYLYVNDNPVNFKDPSGLQYLYPEDVSPEVWRPLREIVDFWYYSLEKLREISKVTAEYGLEILDFWLSRFVWPSKELLEEILKEYGVTPAEAAPAKACP